MMSLIVALEGPDAAGKKTQSELLAKRLRADVYSFPDYNTASGELVKAHLFKKWEARAVCDESCRATECQVLTSDGYKDAHPELKHLDAMVFQGMQTISRLERREAILDSLQRRSVVLDRYWVSGLVYGALDGLSEPWLRGINEKSMPQPDVWVLLDIPLEEIVRRSVERSPEKRDRYESNIEFLGRVKQQYLDVFKAMNAEHRLCPKCGNMVEPCAHCNNTGVWQVWEVVDGMGSKEEVHERIVNTIKKRHAYYFCKDTPTPHR